MVKLSGAVQQAQPDPYHISRLPENKGKELVRIEDRVLKRYLFHRSKAHPGSSDFLAEREEKFIQKAAVQIYDLNVEPEAWVDAQIQVGSKPGAFPYASILVGEKAVERYDSIHASMTATPSNQVFTHGFYVESVVTRTGCTEREAFLDPSIDLRAWYRVLFCPEEIFGAVKKKYLAAAKNQLKQDTRLAEYLNKHYGDRIIRRLSEAIPKISTGPHNPLPPPVALSERRSYYE